MAAKKKTEEVQQLITKEEQDIRMSEIEKENILKNIASTKEALKIGMIKDTPYLTIPNLNSNVSGFLKGGSVYTVYNEINDPDKGSFWDIGGNRFINKDWDVMIFNR